MAACRDHLSWCGPLHLFRVDRSWPVGKPSPPAPDHLHIADTGRAAVLPYFHYFVDLLRGPADHSVDHTSGCFSAPVSGVGLWGGVARKGTACRGLACRASSKHRSQPFTLGFQILILTPELLHLFGNIFPCHTPDSPASSLGKANFVQPVSRRQTITTNAGAATHGIDNDGSACRDSYQSASSTRL